MTGVKNALSVDVEAWFQVEAFREFFPPEKWDGVPLRVEAPLVRLLDLLRVARTRATFFVLGWVAERLPSLVRRIAREGHEVATHGYSHRPLQRLGPEGFREDLRRSVRLLESLTDRRVRGFRAPTFSVTEETLWALDVLLEEGIEYDASIFPVHHDRYGIPDAPRVPHRFPRGEGRTIVEFPPCTLRFGRWNLPAAGGGYLRLFPYPVTRLALRRMNRAGNPAMVYLHPWELDRDQPLPRAAGAVRRWRHVVGISRNDTKIRRLMDDFTFGPVEEVLSLRGLLDGGGPS